MAFVDLQEIREDYLNPILGIADVDDQEEEPWGADWVRNAAISNAFERLWPTMKRLVREALTVDTDATDFALTTIEQLETIERVDDQGRVFAELNHYRQYPDEGTDPPTLRVVLPRAVGTTTETWRALGYVRYTVPVDDADEVDLPTARLNVVVNGARSYLYLRRFNQYLDYEQRATINLENTTSLSELFAAHQAAEAQFQQSMADNAPALRLPRRMKLTRR